MTSGPIFTIVGVDVGSDNLLAQLPIEAWLVRTIPGPGRPDYSLAGAARIAGEQLHAGMTDFPVMLANVIDNTLMSDETLAFSKMLYSAAAFVTGTTQPAVA